MTVHRYDTVIVGAGFAGAATAWHLARAGMTDVAILEMEETPGAHASGRNASLFRQSEADPAIRRAAAASAPFLREHAREVEFRQVGSILLGEPEELGELRSSPAAAAESRPSPRPAGGAGPRDGAGGAGQSRMIEPVEAVERVPLLAGYEIPGALWAPGNGVTETWSLLSLYLRGARQGGAELWTDCAVEGVGGPGPWRLTTTRGVFEAERLVNAAGAWASRLAAAAGVEGPELVPYKRHLFHLEGVPVDPEWPFVWSVADGFYFRPESGGLLFSICDEEPAAPGSSLEETVTPGITDELAQVVFRHLPRLETTRVQRTWSCHRTRPADRRFVLGPDPARPSFVWAAGLGGHGMGCSWEVGRIVAAAMGGEEVPEAFAAGRFAGTGG